MNKIYCKVSVNSNIEKIVCNNHLDLYDYFKNKYNPFHLEITSNEIQIMIHDYDEVQIEQLEWVKEI